MPPILPLPLSDEDMKRAAADMIRIYGSEATAKAEEYIERLNSAKFYSLANTWEVIRDKIRQVQRG